MAGPLQEVHLIIYGLASINRPRKQLQETRPEVYGSVSVVQPQLKIFNYYTRNQSKISRKTPKVAKEPINFETHA